MQRPTVVTIISNGTSKAVPLDRYVNGYALGVTIRTLSGTAGTATYTVQHTFNQSGLKNLDTAVSAVWMNHDNSVFVSATTNGDSNYAYVPSATRIVTSNVSAAEVMYTIIPMGIQ